MAKIDTQFNYLGLQGIKYNVKDRQKNTKTKVVSMLNRSQSIFRWHGLPETIPEKSLEKLLQCHGFTVIGKADGKLYATYAGLGGKYDVYYRPTEATVSIPYLNYNDTWHIDSDCVLVRSDSYMQGLLPVYEKYCSFLTENELTMYLTLVNYRSQSFITANDSDSLKSAGEYIKGLYEGNISVVGSDKLFDSLKSLERKTETDIKDLIEFEQYIIGSLYNEIGLSANYNMKKERLTDADIELNSDFLYPLIDDMLENRRIACEQINDMFNLNVSVELNSAWDYREYENKMTVSTMDDAGDKTEDETEDEIEEKEDQKGDDTDDVKTEI